MSKITKKLLNDGETLLPNKNGKDKFVWDEGDGSIKGAHLLTHL